MSNYSIDWSEFSMQVLITFAHFLWQACIVGFALLAFQHLVDAFRNPKIPRPHHAKRKDGSLDEANLPTASVHYTIASIAFLSLPLIVVATFAWVHQSRGSILTASTARELSQTSIAQVSERAPSIADSNISRVPNTSSPKDLDQPITEPIKTLEKAAAVAPMSPQIHTFAPYILLAYIVGVACMLMRFCLSIAGSSRLRRAIQPITDTALLRLIAEQSARLGLKRTPLVAIGQRLSVPVVIGILKPMILLPPTLLCGLDPQQIAAVLSHEMAHIRRYDSIFNLLQRVVEALLFFHPVTWWISHRVSIEREKCCDDAAVAFVGRLPYASALLQMAELCIGNDRQRSASLATLSANGGNSTDFGLRIRRLIGAEETTQVGMTRRGFSIGIASVALMLVSLMAWIGSNTIPVPGQSFSSEILEPAQTKEADEVTPPAKQDEANAEDTGSVKGRLTLDEVFPTFPKLRVPSPKSPRLSMRPTDEARKELEASLVEIEDESLQCDADGGLANAIVYLPNAPSNWQPPKNALNPLTIALQDYRFEPRAAVVRVGQDLQLNNSGAASENFLFEPFYNGAQNRLVKEGTEFTLKSPFSSAEKMPIQAKSSINIWKTSFLLPLDHPFAAVTDKQGRFTIEGLPSGTHTFRIWHERAGWLEKTLTVNIQKGQTAEVNRSYGLDRFKLEVNPNKLLTVPTDVLWGEAVGGMRLGIRRSDFGRGRSLLRHGEHLDYEVWIKNETDQVVRIARDPSVHYDPKLRDDGSISIVGWSMAVSFMIPPKEFAKAELILPPGTAARRFLSHQHSASIRPPGSPRGRYGSEPLLLEPGKYSVFAQDGDLKSGVEEVEIIPAARLQVRKSSHPTDRSRESVTEDPSAAILTWQAGNGEKQEALINWDGGVMIDERDLASVEIVPVEGQSDQFSIALQLQRKSSSWLSRTIASYSLWDDPDQVAILLDGKPLGAISIPSTIPNDKLIIPVRLPREQAEAMTKEIQAAIASPGTSE